jgi:hypothetical protein
MTERGRLATFDLEHLDVGQARGRQQRRYRFGAAAYRSGRRRIGRYGRDPDQIFEVGADPGQEPGDRLARVPGRSDDHTWKLPAVASTRWARCADSAGGLFARAAGSMRT